MSSAKLIFLYNQNGKSRSCNETLYKDHAKTVWFSPLKTSLPGILLAVWSSCPDPDSSSSMLISLLCGEAGTTAFESGVSGVSGISAVVSGVSGVSGVSVSEFGVSVDESGVSVEELGVSINVRIVFGRRSRRLAAGAELNYTTIGFLPKCSK